MAKATIKKTGSKIGKKKDSSKPNIKQEKRAGISFPVTRIKRYMQKLRANKTVTNTAAVMLCAVLEYLTAEVTDLAGNLALDDNKKTFNQKHLFKALGSDAQLTKVFNGLIHEGGVKQTVTDFRFKSQKQIHDAEKKAQKKADKEMVTATMGA